MCSQGLAEQVKPILGWGLWDRDHRILIEKKQKGTMRLFRGWCREWLTQGGGIWDAWDLDGGVCDG